MKLNDLKNLREALPFGAAADASRKFGISNSAVSQVLYGKINNDDVIQYLLQRAIEYQKTLSKIRNGFEKLPQSKKEV